MTTEKTEKKIGSVGLYNQESKTWEQPSVANDANAEEKQSVVDALVSEQKDGKNFFENVADTRKRLEDQISQLETQKSQAEAEKTRMESEAKAPIIDFLVLNSKGAYAREDLSRLPLEILKQLKSNFVDAVKTQYDEILAQRQAQRDAANRPRGSVGAYNQRTGEWEEGI